MFGIHGNLGGVKGWLKISQNPPRENESNNIFFQQKKDAQNAY